MLTRVRKSCGSQSDGSKWKDQQVALSSDAQTAPKKMARKSDHVDTDLSLFVRFANEKKAASADQLVKATISLIRDCPCARPAVLSLYGSIFDEFCLHYVQTSAGSANAALGNYLTLICCSPVQAEVRRVSSDRRTSSESSNTEEKDTPASPPPPASDETADYEQLNRFNSITSFVDSLSHALTLLVNSDNNRICQVIGEWAVCRMCHMASHFQQEKDKIFSLTGRRGSDSISEKIKYWQSCAVIDILIGIIRKSIEKGVFSLRDVLLRLMDFKPASGSSPQTEWICCLLITSAQDMSETSACIRFLLQSSVSDSAKEAIFSFLSTQNPESVIGCSKSNIPFLLRLCSKSKPLLDTVSQQITRTSVDVQQINQMTNLTLTGNPELQRDMITCLMSSENSCDLMLTICGVTVHPDANEFLVRQCHTLLDAVVHEVHDCVYTGRTGKISQFLDQLKLNFEDIISTPCFSKTKRLKRIQIRLIQILSFHFGIDFAVLLLHQVFSETMTVKVIDVHDLSSLRPNSTLVSLIQSLKLSFGREMRGFCNKLLVVSKEKNVTFWVNFLSFVAAGDEAFEVDLELMTEHLTDFLAMDLYDLHAASGSEIDALVIVLQMIAKSLDRNSAANRFNHNLCVSVVINYVNLVERLEHLSEKSDSEDEMDKLMRAISISQKVMKSLSKSGSGSTSQQILTRTFMECILCWNKELEEEKQMRDRSVVDVCLRSENLNYGGVAFKFRKIPLNPGKDFYGWKNRQSQQPLLSRSFSRQLLMDGIKCCIRQMDLFSHLLVESITPDVMFNDMVWPDEDFLKVTIERDLLICKKYDSHSILWDLTELVAESGLLRNCSVLIRALLAVQLTYWASGTSSEVPDPQSLEATQRLIALLAKSQLIPESPFKFIPSVLPHLNSWEIFCVANDLWKLIRDTSINQRRTPVPLKPYLDRLRIIMANSCPGDEFVKIFKDIETPGP
jgi:hypothetical protein